MRLALTTAAGCLTLLMGQAPPPSLEDIANLDAGSVPITTENLDALKFTKTWSCAVRSPATQAPETDRYRLRFDRGDGNPVGYFIQSGLMSTYEVRAGQLRRISEGAKLERGHRNQPYSV